MTDSIYMFLFATAILSGSLGISLGCVIGYSFGKADGQKDGGDDGFQRGWLAYRDAAEFSETIHGQLATIETEEK